MSEKIEKMLEEIDSLTVIELSELVKVMLRWIHHR